MKKNLCTLFLLSFFMNSLCAQNLLNRVPASAALVIKYSGENAVKRMPVQKLNSYSFVRNDLFKAFGLADVKSIQATGINFEEDAYRYIAADDTTVSFVTLLRIKNIKQFLQTLHPLSKPADTTKTEKMAGYELLRVSENTFIAWNHDVAAVVESRYTNRRNYWRYESDTTTMVTIDSTGTMDEELTDTATVSTEPQVYRNEAPTKRKSVEKENSRKIKKKSKKKKGEAAGEQKEEIIELQEDVQGPPPPPPPPPPSAMDREMIIEAPKTDAEGDSAENLKRELWYQQQEMIARGVQRETAIRIFDSSFNVNIRSIGKEESYQKTIDSNGHLTAWFNYTNLFSQYRRLMYGDVYSYMLGSRPAYSADSTGLKTGLNVYFDNDKIRVENRSFSPDTLVQSLSKQMLNSRQSDGLTGYINPGNLGFASVSINSEAAAKYYYTWLKQYMRNTPYMKEYGEITDMYVDLLEIAIDEKSLSDLSPGNYLFVLHDMKTRKVDYIDYSFDSEYKKKEVTKTTKELAPDFSFVMETKNEAFMEKLAKLPLKYAEKNKYDYKDMGGYYRLSFDSTKNAVHSLFFMVRNGRVIVTTSQEVINMTLRGGSFTTDEETKQFVLANNYAAKINTKKILDIVYTRAPEGAYKKLCGLFKDNFGEIKVESKYADGVIKGTSTVNIKGKHSNGLEFIFNIMQGVVDIEEKEAKKREKNAD